MCVQVSFKVQDAYITTCSPADQRSSCACVTHCVHERVLSCACSYARACVDARTWSGVQNLCAMPRMAHGEQSVGVAGKARTSDPDSLPAMLLVSPSARGDRPLGVMGRSSSVLSCRHTTKCTACTARAQLHADVIEQCAPCVQAGGSAHHIACVRAESVAKLTTRL